MDDSRNGNTACGRASDARAPRARVWIATGVALVLIAFAVIGPRVEFAPAIESPFRCLFSILAAPIRAMRRHLTGSTGEFLTFATIPLFAFVSIVGAIYTRRLGWIVAASLGVLAYLGLALWIAALSV